jgi:hypothetical protein
MKISKVGFPIGLKNCSKPYFSSMDLDDFVKKKISHEDFLTKTKSSCTR